MNRRQFIGGSAMLLAPGGAAAGRASVENYAGLGRPVTLNLNGTWHMREDPSERGEAEEWFQPGRVRGRMGNVPLPWQLAFEDLRDYSGTVWYERAFQLPAECNGKRVALVFEAVDHAAKVWVNGHPVGGHEGGQTPFLLDISRVVAAGPENVVTVKVTDPAEGLSFFMDTHSLINISGIWRNVWLEATGQTHAASLFAVPDIDGPAVVFRVEVAGRSSGQRLRLMVQAPGGEQLRHEQPLDSDAFEVPLRLKSAELWELDHPRLYQAQATIVSDKGDVADSASIDFGMRKIEARGDRVYLNNRPIYLVGGGLDPGPYGGAVDINWHLPPPYAPLSDEQIQHDIRTTKSLGVNFARVPLRAADPRFLYWADRMGLLVMQGGPWTPTEGIAGAAGFARYQEWWTEAVLRDRNHPSLVLWELFNESFGMSWESFKEIAGQLYNHVKSLDPTRFVLDNAGGRYLNELNYIGNHGSTDIQDVHSYPGFPSSFEGHSNEMRYPHTSAELWRGIRSRGKPVLVTEFAPAPYIYNVDKIKRKWGGKDPWWFHVRARKAAMFAQWDHIGFEDRFHEWGFEEIYGDFTQFTEASDWYYFDGLKYYTELMRMNPELAGYVCWLFDSAPHAVGSVDFFKDKKVYGDELARIWTQDLAIIDNRRPNVWAGETIRADVHVSHFSPGSLRGRVMWSLEGTSVHGTIEGISLESGEIRRAGQIVFRAPDPGNARTHRLRVRLEHENRVLSENFSELRIFSLDDRKPLVKRVNFVGFDQSRFQVLGYDVPAAAARPSHPGLRFDPQVPVTVTATLEDPLLQQYLRDGGTVILMICEEANYWERRPVLKLPVIEKLLRANGLALGGRFQGGHSDSYFIRKPEHGLFRRIPFRNPIAWPFYKVWPNNSIIGWPAADRRDMLAGAYGNLIRSVPMDTEGKQRWSEVSGTLVQGRCGKGRLIISTFELASPCLDDPVAAIMLNDLVEYSTTSFQPGRELVLG